MPPPPAFRLGPSHCAAKQLRHSSQLSFAGAHALSPQLWRMLDINNTGAINFVEFTSILFPKSEEMARARRSSAHLGAERLPPGGRSVAAARWPVDRGLGCQSWLVRLPASTILHHAA